MSTVTAPIALFIFNRPHLTAQVFERVRAARPRRLLVVADGPRPTRPDEARLCEAARKIATSPDWPCELLTNFADQNMGCRRRVSSGLDWVFKECPEAIILEDDCVPCPSFFRFCSAMLEHYREDARIMHISGINFQDGVWRGPGSYYFSRYSLSWGWASWSRAWRHYDVTIAAWPTALADGWLGSILDDAGEIDYWTKIFAKLYDGQIDTWDYQWLFTCWRQQGLSIHPNENLVTNIGAGPDATHFQQADNTMGIPTRELGECVHPPVVIRDQEADRSIFQQHIGRQPLPEKQNWFRYVRKKIALGTRIKGLAQMYPPSK
jgi:hypothetical protein